MIKEIKQNGEINQEVPRKKPPNADWALWVKLMEHLPLGGLQV